MKDILISQGQSFCAILYVKSSQVFVIFDMFKVTDTPLQQQPPLSNDCVKHETQRGHFFIYFLALCKIVKIENIEAWSDRSYIVNYLSPIKINLYSVYVTQPVH